MQDIFIKEVPPKHYYGDIVRKLLMAGAVVVLCTLPFLYTEWPLTFYIWVILAFAVGVFAGVTNPKLQIVAIADFIIASIGFLFFGIDAIRTIQIKGALNLHFFTSEILMLIFFFDVYFTVKTVRGMLLHK